MQELRIIKLTSGEELIARVTSEDDLTVTVSKARAVHAIQMPDGMTYRIALVPFSPAAPDSKITVYKSGITASIAESNIPPEFASEYTKQTSDIEIVSGNLSSIITG